MHPNVCLYTIDLFVCLVAYFNFFFYLSLSLSFLSLSSSRFGTRWRVSFCLFVCVCLFFGFFLSNATVSLGLNFECLKVCLGNVLFPSLPSSFPSSLLF